MSNLMKFVLQPNLRSRKLSCLLKHLISTNAKSPYIDIPYVGYSRILSLWNGGPRNYHMYIESLHNKHGPVFYKETIEGDKVLFVKDPDLNLEVYRCEGRYPIHVVPEAWKLCLEELKLKRGLFFMDGVEWKKNRTAMTEIMGLQNSVGKLTPLLNWSAMHLVNKWKQNLPSGKHLERDLYKWSCESVALAFVGTNLEKAKRTGTCVNLPDEFMNAAYAIFQLSSSFYVIPPYVAKQFDMTIWKKLRESIITALKVGQEIVESGLESYRVHDTIHPCFLKDMLQSRHKISDETIVRIIIDMIITSGDTSGMTALWTFYVLGRNPEIAEICHKEVKETLGNREEIDLSDLAKMPYLAAVCKEVIRLYPVAPFLSRQTASVIMYGKYFIPKDTMVATSLFTMLRDGNVYNDPKKCIPERWLHDTENTSKEKKGSMTRSFIPFGIGGRSCIGKHLAKAQNQILVAHLLLNFKWEALEDVEPVLRMITVPSKNLRIDIRERKTCN